MPEPLPVNLNCPTCGAPLEVDGKSTMVRCKFCRNTCVLPGLQGEQAGPGPSLEQVRRLLEGGDRLEAIRIFRELTGTGLREAEQAVQALQAGRLAEHSEALRVTRDPDEFSRVLRDVQSLLQAGNKVGAIKRYRESYDVSMARAQFAVERIQAGETVWPEKDLPVPPAVVGTGAQRPGRGCGGAIAAGILVFVLAIVGLALAMPGGPFTPRLVAVSPAVLVGPESAAPDVALAIYNASADTRLVGLVDGATGRLRWRSPELPGDGFVQAIASDGERVYAASGTTLLAYQVSDGSLAWQASLSDRVYSEQGCLLLLDGQVIVLTLDWQVQALDASTGAATWNRPLEATDYQIRSVQDQLLVLDAVPDSSDLELVFLEARTGTVLRTIAPSCQPAGSSMETLDSSGGMRIDPEGGKVYLLYGFFNGCIDRYDLASGGLDWQISQEDGFRLSPDGFQSLLTAEGLVFSDYQRLLRVDPNGSSLLVLQENEDYTFVPLAERDGVLLVRAERTLGTQRFELWGLDPVSGDRLWSLDLSPAGPLDPPDEMIALVDEEEPGWTWHGGAAGLQLLFFQANPNRIVIRDLDLAKGELGTELPVELRRVSGEFYSVPEVVGWRGTVLYVLVDAYVFALDVSTGELVLATR